MRANEAARHDAEYETFQLPPSHEGEPALADALAAAAEFQLPPSHEGEPPLRADKPGAIIFQLPPSHEGERRMNMVVKCMENISTPALA